MQVKRNSILLGPDMEPSGAFMFPIQHHLPSGGGENLLKKNFKIQSQWKSLPGPEYGHKWQMRGRKHPVSYDPSMTVWSEHMREHVIICFFTLFYKENLHPTKARKAAWYICFYCILPQILPPLWFYFHVPMRTCVCMSLWWSHQLSPFTAGMKCTSWEIALDMKAKTSPPLQYDQKKKEEEKKKKVLKWASLLWTLR